MKVAAWLPFQFATWEGITVFHGTISELRSGVGALYELTVTKAGFFWGDVLAEQRGQGSHPAVAQPRPTQTCIRRISLNYEKWSK